MDTSTRPVRPPRYWEPPLLVTAVFLTFVVARYMQWGARKPIFETLHIEFMLGLVVALSCVLLLPAAPLPLGRLRPARRVLIAIGLLFFAMIIQLPFAADPITAKHIFMDRVIKFAMLTFFMAVLIRSPRAMHWFIAAFLFACFYVTQEATRGAISGYLIWENQGTMRLHGAVPIYAHPNSLAGVAMGVVPFVVFLYPRIRRRWVKLLTLAPLGTSLTCLLYSGSRTGYVAFFSFMLYWWWQSPRKGRWLLVATAVSLTVYPLLPRQYVERFESITGQEKESHSKEARIQILKDAVVVFAEHPLGVGVASFPAVRWKQFGRIQDTHNLYLEVATNLGVQGLVVFAMLLVALLQAFAQSRRQAKRIGRRLQLLMSESNRPSPAYRVLYSNLRYLDALAVAGAGFVWVRMALGMFGMDLYEVYWWFASGLAICLAVILDRLEGYVNMLESRDVANSSALGLGE